MFSPFRAELGPVGYLRALPGVGFVYAFQAMFLDLDFLHTLI
jgi:hypothetical protein